MAGPFSIDGTIWHKCTVAPLFASESDERKQPGPMWRREVSGKSEYFQDTETQEQVDRRAY